MNCPVLSPRLLKIAELVPPCRVFLDVGTDHAYLPVYLLKKGICKRAIASDLKKGPLDRAARTAESFGVSHLTELRLGSGFETVASKEADAAAVAGMGGILIAELLKASEDTVRQLKTLILQPMTAVYELRKFLNENNYTVKSEFLVKEDEKLYHILSVTGEIPEKQTDAELYMGKELLRDNNALCREYIRRQIRKLNRQISGLEKSKSPADAVILDEKKKLLSEIKSLPERGH